ncbi:MAG: NADH-quinone oxidoreductase subunit H [Parcubacteria group bacterium]|nr:NADH-quinone oxidoreductase subunit H [Parcubacteria group bacterium]
MAIILVQSLMVPLLSPLAIGIIRKIKAKMTNRQGASVFQPYRDLWKLFHKDEIISADASWISKFAPYLIFAATLVVAMNIPVISARAGLGIASDIITVIYLFALGAFFLALLGLDAGSPFGGFGSSREMTMAALTEGGMLFSLLALALLARSTQLEEIMYNLSELSFPVVASMFFAFLGFMIALLSENARYPFDNPATHLELTMIHEAMILESSGKRLALLEWAAANKLLIFIALAANLFFPWGMPAAIGLESALFGFALFAIKAFIFLSFIAILESTIAKLRFFRLPDLLLTSFMLGVIAIVITII